MAYAEDNRVNADRNHFNLLPINCLLYPPAEFEICEWVGLEEPIFVQPFQIEEILGMLTVACDMPLGFDVLFWLFIEGFLATIRAEIIRLSFVIGLTSRSLGINVHAANGIFYHESHLLSLNY